MTIIPDRVSDASDRIPGISRDRRNAQNGSGGGFVRVLDAMRRTGAASTPTRTTSMDAHVFDEYGFFQGTTVAGADPTDTKESSAKAADGLSEGDPAVSPPRGDRVAGSTKEQRGRPASSGREDGGTDARRSRPVILPSKAHLAARPMSPTYAGPPVSTGPAVGSDEKMHSAVAGSRVVRPLPPSADAAAASDLQVSARQLTDGLDIMAHVESLDRGKRTKLRDAIIGMLARHGLVPARVHVRGAPPKPEGDGTCR